MSSADTPINWKRNLTVTWLGCFLTGAAFSLVMPFLPLYVEQLGVTGHSALNMWSGLVFSITFLFSAIASPFWGGLADRKGRKIMLLRSALGMAIVMMLMGMAQNIWQFLLLRALLGLLGGFIPNANALIATQIPRHKSGWALGTLSTGAVSGALLGPLAGGFLADHWGLRTKRWKLFLIPEEYSPPQVLKDTDAYLTLNRQRSLDDGFMHAVFNPSFNALATAMATARHRQGHILEIARERHVEQALNETPDKLNRDRRLVLLSDPVTMSRLHYRVWAAPEKYSSWVNAYQQLALNPLALKTK